MCTGPAVRAPRAEHAGPNLKRLLRNPQGYAKALFPGQAEAQEEGRMRWRKPHIRSMRNWRELGFSRRLWICDFPDLSSKAGIGITPQIAWVQLLIGNGLHHPALYP